MIFAAGSDQCCDEEMVLLPMEMQGILRIMVHKQPQSLSMSGGALLKGW